MHNIKSYFNEESRKVIQNQRKQEFEDYVSARMNSHAVEPVASCMISKELPHNEQDRESVLLSIYPLLSANEESYQECIAHYNGNEITFYKDKIVVQGSSILLDIYSEEETSILIFENCKFDFIDFSGSFISKLLFFKNCTFNNCQFCDRGSKYYITEEFKNNILSCTGIGNQFTGNCQVIKPLHYYPDTPDIINKVSAYQFIYPLAVGLVDECEAQEVIVTGTKNKIEVPKWE